jgi:hypothetical protein
MTKKELLSKSEALELFNSRIGNVLTHKNTCFSNRNAAGDVWWLEPALAKWETGFYFILNNERTQTLHLFQVPKKTISKSQFRERSKKGCSYLILPISDKLFRENRGADLTKYLVESLKY